MESNNTIENEFVINDNLEDITINKATEVPLNPIEPSLSMYSFSINSIHLKSFYINLYRLMSNIRSRTGLESKPRE